MSRGSVRARSRMGASPTTWTLAHLRRTGEDSTDRALEPAGCCCHAEVLRSCRTVSRTTTRQIEPRRTSALRAPRAEASSGAASEPTIAQDTMTASPIPRAPARCSSATPSWMFSVTAARTARRQRQQAPAPAVPAPGTATARRTPRLDRGRPIPTVGGNAPNRAPTRAVAPLGPRTRTSVATPNPASPWRQTSWDSGSSATAVAEPTMFSRPPTARAASTFGARSTTRIISDTTSRVRRSVLGPGNGTRHAKTVASRVSATATDAMKGRVAGISEESTQRGTHDPGRNLDGHQRLGGPALGRSCQFRHRCCDGRIGGSPAGDGERGRDDCQHECLVEQGHRKQAQKRQRSTRVAASSRSRRIRSPSEPTTHESRT